MGQLLDKFKKMFVEELDDEVVIKKQVIPVKINKPEETKHQTVEKPVVNVVDEEEEEPVIPVVEKVEEKVVVKETPVEKPAVKTIPTYFDDDDFTPTSIQPKRYSEPQVLKQEYKYTKTETKVATPTITGYGIKRDEPRKKTFTPTPIISPVYGVLDKNYRKDEIKSKNTPRETYSNEKVSLDDIRKKAYGTLEDELENELSGKIEQEKVIDETPLYSDFLKDFDKDKDNEPIDIFKEVGEIDKKDALDDYIMGYENTSGSLVEEELNKDYDKYEEELNKSRTKEYSDDDLFNLIDSMYKKKDGE